MTKKTQKRASKARAADPIFALIEKHRAAEAAFCRAVSVYNKITEGKHPRIEDDAKVWVGGHRIESPDDLPEWRKTAVDAIEHLFGAVGGPGKKRRLRARALFTKAIAVNVEGLKRTFADEQRKIDHLRKTSGYDAANTRYHATCDASRDALTKLISTIPTTPEGLTAMLAYVASKPVTEQLEGLEDGNVGALLAVITKTTNCINGRAQ